MVAAPTIALGSRVVVVLDTSVVRHFAAGDKAGRRFRSLKDALPLARFCLSDTSVGELGLWLARAEEQQWAEWKAVQRDVADVLDGDAPLAHAHHPSEHAPSPEHARAIARLLCTAHSRADLQAGFHIDGENKAVLLPGDALRLLESDIEKWCNFVTTAAHVAASESNFDVLLASLQAAFARVHGEQATRRLEPYARAVARFLEIRRRGYDPRGGGRKGDHLDVRLISTLMSVDYVCTNDGRLLEHLRQAGCRDMDRIVSLAGLIETIEQGRLSPFTGEG